MIWLGFGGGALLILACGLADGWSLAKIAKIEALILAGWLLCSLALAAFPFLVVAETAATG